MYSQQAPDVCREAPISFLILNLSSQPRLIHLWKASDTRKIKTRERSNLEKNRDMHGTEIKMSKNELAAISSESKRLYYICESKNRVLHVKGEKEIQKEK